VTEINVFKNARETTEVAAGTVLFNAGDEGNVMYAVVEGTIDLEREGRVLDKIGPGGIVGEMALVDDVPRSATARASSDARVVSVDAEHFTYLVQEHPTFALQVMRVMAERLRRANERV
jgi:CRP-like cAMP-binding protein